MASHPILHYTLLATYLLVFSVNYYHVGATEYTVGGEEGWTFGQNYLAWSQSYNFTVGDVLYFSYVKGQHNVYQVKEVAYESCDWRNGVIKIYNTGNDRVSLTDVTSYYFLCNIKGHCRGGMKFGINVTSASASPSPDGGSSGEVSPPPPPTQLPPPPPPPPPLAGSNDAAGGGMGWWRSWWCLAVIPFLLSF